MPNQSSSISSKLDAALKTQQFLLKKVKYKFIDSKPAIQSDNSYPAKKLKETPPEIINMDKSNDRKMPQHIDVNHCLAVAKGLLHLVLSMDHSSSADLLLISFKVSRYI